MARAVLATTLVHLKATLVRPTVQVMVLAQPLMMATLAFFVHDAGEAASRFFVVLGSGLSGMWVATAFTSAGDLERERFQGTIQPVMASATSLWAVSAGRALGALALSVVPVAVSLAFSELALGLRPPPQASALGLVLAVAAFGLGCHAVGTALGHVFLLSRRTLVLQNVLEWPVLIAAGVLIPVGALPRAVEVVAAALPMRWAAEAAQAAFATGAILWTRLALALAVSGFYVIVAAALSRVIERRVRVTASLEVA